MPGNAGATRNAKPEKPSARSQYVRFLWQHRSRDPLEGCILHAVHSRVLWRIKKRARREEAMRCTAVSSPGSGKSSAGRGRGVRKMTGFVLVFHSSSKFPPPTWPTTPATSSQLCGQKTRLTLLVFGPRFHEAKIQVHRALWPFLQALEGAVLPRSCWVSADFNPTHLQD